LFSEKAKLLVICAEGLVVEGLVTWRARGSCWGIRARRERGEETIELRTKFKKFGWEIIAEVCHSTSSQWREVSYERIL